MPIRELTDGTQVDIVLLVQTIDRRARANGEDFLKLQFCDRTGTLASVVWDDVDTIESLLVVGAPFRVFGRYEVHEKFGPQLRLEGFEPAADGSYDPSDLRQGPPVPVPELEARLRALVASVADPGMQAMLQAVLGEGTATWEAYRVAPAAKRVHQAYRHGLLEHCLTVAEAVDGASKVFPGIDRDLAVSAALVHDIGKLDAYAFTDGDTVELTDDGKLRGEIVLGYERLHRVVDAIPGMSEVRKQAFLHIILAHHGHLEHGSPVTPQTREAFLVHTMDNLGGKLGIVDRLENERQPGSSWSGFDRAFGGAVWFADEAEEAGAAQPPSPVTDAPALAHDHAPSHPPVLGASPAESSMASPVEPAPATEEPTAAPVEPAPEPAPAAVPLRAFEESPAWNPPAPESLDAPPLPTETLTETPDHGDEPFGGAATTGEPEATVRATRREGAEPPSDAQPLPF